jgi:septal ring factor EnvC (AmiA/AmiB activator)
MDATTPDATIHIFLLIISILFSVVSGAVSILAIIMLKHSGTVNSFIRVATQTMNDERTARLQAVTEERGSRRRFEEVQKFRNGEMEKDIANIKKTVYDHGTKLTEQKGTLARIEEEIKRYIKKLEDHTDDHRH